MFVRQDNGCTQRFLGRHFILLAKFVQQCVHLFCLTDTGRNTDHLNLCFRFFLRRKRILRREVFKIPFDKIGCFIIPVRHFIRSIIPIEISDSPFLQLHQETFLRDRQGIQTDKDYLQIRQVTTVILLHQFNDFTEDHTFIASSLRRQRFTQIGVQRIQDFPDSQKFFLVRRISLRIERRPECTDCCYLIFIQETEIVLYLPQVRHIRKQHAGICHIFIDIIKVVQQHFPPIEELVKGFRRAAMPDIDIVQHEQHIDLICRLFAAQLHKQVVDGQDRRREKRLVRHLRKIFLKEQACSPVRENKCQLTHLCSVLLIKQRGYLV